MRKHQQQLGKTGNLAFGICIDPEGKKPHDFWP
jgi:hypothetical protein